MKKFRLITCITILCLLINSLLTAQNVGTGTAIPAARLDILSLNNRDLVNTEGDIRIGNKRYRIKFGIATSAGGAGVLPLCNIDLLVDIMCFPWVLRETVY